LKPKTLNLRFYMEIVKEREIGIVF